MGAKTHKIFKGLQKPLEFMGLKGRYVWVGLGGALSSILLFIILYISINFVTALLALLITPSAIAYWIFKNMKKGLHSKQEDKGVYVVMSVISRKPIYDEKKEKVGASVSDC